MGHRSRRLSGFYRDWKFSVNSFRTPGDAKPQPNMPRADLDDVERLPPGTGDRPVPVELSRPLNQLRQHAWPPFA